MNYPGVESDAAWRAALRPATYRNPTPKPRYHLVVVGAGPAGLVTAIGAAGLGARVALVERHLMGGDCLNVGCVPSKALLEYTAHHPDGDFDGAFAWLRQVRAAIAPHDSVARYTEAGVDVFLGDAVLEDAETVRVGEVRLSGRRIALCTGAAASVPPIPGLRESAPLTNETLFDLRQRPARLAILGGGPIGCELAQAFARLGVAVDLFELADRLLPLEDAAAGELLAEAMVGLGVKLHLGAAVEQVQRGPDGASTILAGSTRVTADQVLVALGRRPNTAGLGLDRAGVTTDAQGHIEVDAKLRTANRRIFAAGDCASILKFTHHADAQARALIQNALFLPTARVDGLVVPRCTYTQPEVAAVGDNRTALAQSGVEFDCYRVAFDELDRGQATPGASGFAEVYCRRGTDRILGATLVGPDAGEQLAPLCLLMSRKLGLSAVGGTLLSYPTRSEYLKRLSDAYNRTRLTPRVAGLMRRWLDWLV